MRRRAIKGVIKFNILILLSSCNTAEIYTENKANAHLNNERIRDICGKIDDICFSSDMRLCTVRTVKGRLQFKQFENNCYLFLYNMCVCPGNEWAIKDVGSCKNPNLRRYAEQVESAQSDVNYTVASELTTDINPDATKPMTDGSTERADDKITIPDENTDTNADKTTEDNTGLTTDDTQVTADDNTGLVTEDNIESMTSLTEVMTGENAEHTTDDNTEEPTAAGDFGSPKPALRALPRTTYGVEQAPDGHDCPYHCPAVYSPVCVNVNRGEGKYYKLLFFVNHCEADRHYCLFWETVYQPPPTEEYEMVRPPSNAAWSYCAGNKYMNFATFAESASSMGHYGWLKGNQRPQHIMEPYERVPGFG